MDKAVVQSGVSRRPIRPICPIRPIGCPLARRRRACGCRGDWKLGSLEVWRLGFLGGAPSHTPTIPPSPVYRALCSPFSGAALAAPPLPGRGAAPHTLQSANQPIPLCSLRFFSAFVGAAQRGVSSPPKAAVRASTSVAPPILQASKLPSFSGASFVSFVFSPKHPTPSQRPTRRPAGALSVLRSLWPWKVWRVAPARSVLRGGISRPSPIQSAGR